VSIREFRTQLAKKGLTIGSRWAKADFHVHLPSSHDYEYKGDDAFEKLGAALEAQRLAFAVVLKHETFATKAELARLQPHCPSVTLVPGSEVNVIVDALFKKIGKDYFFHCIVAANPEDTDEYGHVLRSAIDTMQYRSGDYPAGFKSGLLDVGRFFRRKGCLFIAAHLHNGKSPANSRSVDILYDDDAFLGFIRDNAFDALEVTQSSTAAFFDGAHHTDEGVSIPRISCVSSSDAHHPDQLAERKRFTWVEVENASFPELHSALALPHRVSLERPMAAHPRIVGIHIVGSFFGDAWLNVNRGLNALIGSKGSGKTAVLECVRFVLNTPVPPERVQAVSQHVQHILGSSGYVECLVQGTEGEQTLITRRADAPDRIVLLSENGDSRVAAAMAGPVFPISILGWHEIESVADRASARIGILDRARDSGEVQSAYEEIRGHIAKARDQLPLLQRQVRRLGDSLKDLWELKRKRSTLARLEAGELSGLQNQYEWFLATEQRLASIIKGAIERLASLGEVIPSRLETDIPSAPVGTPLGALDVAITALAAGAATGIDAEHTATTGLANALGDLRDRASDASASLTLSFTQFRDVVYTPKVNELPQEEREILTRQIQVLEETKRLPTVEAVCAEELRELRVLAQGLLTSCEAVCALRDKIATLRGDLVDALNSELTGVKLAFKRSANHEARDRYQGSFGSEGATVIGYLDSFSGVDGYDKLRTLFTTLANLDLDQDKWKIRDTFYDAKLIALLDVIDDDDVDISLSVGNRGFVPIQNLSAGQRCVAIFPLLLRNTKGPLVIDQPEDNLDNRYIADIIGPELLTKKRGQQYLVTSHNANLVVLTDADLIIHVDSDGTKANFPAAGFLACAESEVKKSVLDVLDGGETALLARQMKYGIVSPSPR
jgi:DNA repair ATPase RecN